MRLDKFLKLTGLIKRRPVAKESAEGRESHSNNQGGVGAFIKPIVRWGVGHAGKDLTQADLSNNLLLQMLFPAHELPSIETLPDGSIVYAFPGDLPMVYPLGTTTIDGRIADGAEGVPLYEYDRLLKLGGTSYGGDISFNAGCNMSQIGSSVSGMGE